MSRAVLIIEDEPILAKNIKVYLARYGYECLVASSAEEGLLALNAFSPNMILLDYHLPNMDGLQALEQLRTCEPATKIVMITGHGNVEVAVKAMKLGAWDYLSKPVVLSELKLLVDTAIDQAPILGNDTQLSEKATQVNGLNRLIGESPPMLELKESMRRVIAAEYSLPDSDVPAVLITGETGTGKELVARALHFDGQRRTKPFIEINCASIPPHLLEAELFGYERGAFTDARTRKCGLIEAAQGGTLFLDEIGEVDLQFQTKILKVIEEKKVRRLGGLQEIPVNFRIIAATNQDLEKLVQEGKFRADLYFRLRILSLNVPPLRLRKQDIVHLSKIFLGQHSLRYRKPRLYFTEQAEQVLLQWSWPGNVRELRNTLEQVVLMAAGEAIHASDFHFNAALESSSKHAFVPKQVFDAKVSSSNDLPTDGLNLEKIERLCLLRALENTSWNITQAAKLLGLSRDTLRYRMEKHRVKNSYRTNSSPDGQ